MEKIDITLAKNIMDPIKNLHLKAKMENIKKIREYFRRAFSLSQEYKNLVDRVLFKVLRIIPLSLV